MFLTRSSPRANPPVHGAAMCLGAAVGEGLPAGNEWVLSGCPSPLCPPFRLVPRAPDPLTGPGWGDHWLVCSGPGFCQEVEWLIPETATGGRAAAPWKGCSPAVKVGVFSQGQASCLAWTVGSPGIPGPGSHRGTNWSWWQPVGGGDLDKPESATSGAPSTPAPWPAGGWASQLPSARQAWCRAHGA